jgi:hypothetical protein
MSNSRPHQSHPASSDGNVYALLGRELVEPISRADRRARLEAAVRDNPEKSLRELARQEGSSRSTIQRIRKRLDEGVPL